MYAQLLGYQKLPSPSDMEDVDSLAPHLHEQT